MTGGGALSGFGAWAVRHRFAVLAVWAGLLALGLVGASHVSSVLSASIDLAAQGQARVVQQALQRFPGQDPFNLILVVRSPQSGPAVDTPVLRPGLEDIVRRLRTEPGVGRTMSILDPGVPRDVFLSPGGHTTLIFVGLDVQSASAAQALVPAIRKRLGAMDENTLTVKVTGSPAVYYDLAVAVDRGTVTAELIGLPLTAMVLILAFGSLLAAGVPLLIGVLSSTVSLAALYAIGTLSHHSFYISAESIVTMLALALGIDYSLLMVARFREAMAAGLPSHGAAIEAVRTAGHTILVSGSAVTLSLLSLMIAPLLRSLGLAGAMTVAVAVATALTAVPALLAVLGKRVNTPTALSRWLSGTSLGNHSWSWGLWARRVSARPLLSILVVLAIMAAIALPALALKPGIPGLEALPAGSESLAGAQELQAMGMTGAVTPLDVLIDTGQKDGILRPKVIAALTAVTRRISDRTDVASVVGPTSGPAWISTVLYQHFYRTETVARSGPLAMLADMTISTGANAALLTILPSNQLAAAHTRRLERAVRAAMASQPALDRATLLFGGVAEANAEALNTGWSKFPLVVLIVLATIFVLLMLSFRSLLVPLKAVVLNGLSVAASYGVLVAVFQHGMGASLLGFTPPRPERIEFLIPILLFAVTFGLSMDYEVFLVGRIREEHLRGASVRESIELALEHTGPVITWAAAIMTIVFASFLAAGSVSIKELGLPLAAAILLDATLVRMVLVPAFMTLAGHWNWWLPWRGSGR